MATFDLLSELHVDFAQGFVLGRPAPVQELLPTKIAHAPAQPGGATLAARRRESRAGR